MKRCTVERLVAAAACTALLFFIGCSDGGVTSGQVDVERSATTTREVGGWELFASLGEGLGPNEVTLRRQAEEIAAGGPSALAIGPDGVIAIADTLAGRIIRVRPNAAALAPIAMYGVEDVAFDQSGQLYAFSRASSRVSVFEEAGQEVENIELPRTMRWITGFCPMPGGGIGLHTAYQESVPLDAQNLHLGLADGVPGSGGERYHTLRRNGAASIEILNNDSSPARRLEVPVATTLGSLVFLGATDDGTIVVDVQDVVRSNPIEVERSLRRYGSDSALLGQVSVPRGTSVPGHPLELGRDGTVYFLKQVDAGVEIWTWPGRVGGAR